MKLSDLRSKNHKEKADTDFLAKSMEEKTEHTQAKTSIQDNDTILEKFDNPYLARPMRGLELCARLVDINHASSEVSDKLAQFRDLVQHDFVHLTETDDNTTGAEAVRQLMSIAGQLEDMIQFPSLSRYFTVAVGGMFSSGKSRFLNTILGCGDLLPVDTTPTTAIPSYIVKGNRDGILALNRFQSVTTLDDDGLHAICHAFKETFHVSFSHLLRLIAIERKQLNYGNIVFLDTPGYSKGDSMADEKQVDEDIAREHLRNADYLIWLIDIENGSVPKGDLDFIRRLNFSKPILFIFNKADKKMPHQIQEIIGKAKTILNGLRDIKVYDVIAFSSEDNVEFGGKGILQAFLSQVATTRPGDPILFHLQNVFKDYDSFYSSHFLELKAYRAVCNDLLLERKMSNDVQKQLGDMSAGYAKRMSAITESQKELKQISERAIALVKDIAGKLEIKLADHETEAMSTMDVGNLKEYSCSAFLQDAQKLNLVDKGRLDSLKGKVVDVTPMWFIITPSETDAEFKVMLTVIKLKQQTGLSDNDLKLILQKGKEVRLQIISSKECKVFFK